MNESCEKWQCPIDQHANDGVFPPKNQSSGLTSAQYFWERDGRIIWRNKKHMDKRVYYLSGCSSPGVVDSRGKFKPDGQGSGTTKGTARSPGLIRNPWKSKRGKGAGSVL